MVLDTNILIAYLNDESIVIETIENWKRGGRVLFISSITTAEVLALPSLRPVDGDRIRKFLGNFVSVPMDDDVAESAATIRRLYRLEIPDATIAATALINGVPLVTRDRQFRRVFGLILVTL